MMCTRVRECIDVIEWLPDTSAYAASVLGGPKHLGWGMDRWFAYRETNETIIGNYLTRLINSKPGKDVDKPVLMPAPGDAERKKLASGQRRASLMAKLRAKRQVQPLHKSDGDE